MAIEPETVERTFTVVDTGDLVLSNIAGNVEIRGWDYDEISVKATKRPGNWLPFGTPEEAFRATRDRHRAAGAADQCQDLAPARERASPASSNGSVASPRSTTSSGCPDASSILVDLVSAALTVEDVRGNLIIRTVSARQELRSLAGNLVISTVSGGVAAEGMSGKASLRTVSGGVRITRSQLESHHRPDRQRRHRRRDPNRPDRRLRLRERERERSARGAGFDRDDCRAPEPLRLASLRAAGARSKS